MHLSGPRTPGDGVRIARARARFVEGRLRPWMRARMLPGRRPPVGHCARRPQRARPRTHTPSGGGRTCVTREMRCCTSCVPMHTYMCALSRCILQHRFPVPFSASLPKACARARVLSVARAAHHTHCRLTSPRGHSRPSAAACIDTSIPAIVGGISDHVVKLVSVGVRHFAGWTQIDTRPTLGPTRISSQDGSSIGRGWLPSRPRPRLHPEPAQNSPRSIDLGWTTDRSWIGLESPPRRGRASTLCGPTRPRMDAGSNPSMPGPTHGIGGWMYPCVGATRLLARRWEVANASGSEVLRTRWRKSLATGCRGRPAGVVKQ